MKGNFIDRHPDYRALLLRYFPRLKELDGMQVTEGIRSQIKDAEQIRKLIIVFFYKIDQRIAKVAAQLNAIGV